MVHTCIVCKRVEYLSPEDLSFHRFPKDPERKKIWFGLVGILESQQIPKFPEICSDHFKPEDLQIRSNGLRYIKPGANPYRCEGLIVLDESSNSSDSTETSFEKLPVFDDTETESPTLFCNTTQGVKEETALPGPSGVIQHCRNSISSLGDNTTRTFNVDKSSLAVKSDLVSEEAIAIKEEVLDDFIDINEISNIKDNISDSREPDVEKSTKVKSDLGIENAYSEESIRIKEEDLNEEVLHIKQEVLDIEDNVPGFQDSDAIFHNNLQVDRKSSSSDTDTASEAEQLVRCDYSDDEVWDHAAYCVQNSNSKEFNLIRDVLSLDDLNETDFLMPKQCCHNLELVKKTVNHQKKEIGYLHEDLMRLKTREVVLKARLREMNNELKDVCRHPTKQSTRRLRRLKKNKWTKRKTTRKKIQENRDRQTRSSENHNGE